MKNRLKNMTPIKTALAGLICATAFLAAGCSHRLVASTGEHTINVYPDQATFDKLQNLKSQGGPMGMIGGMGESVATKAVDDQTPVRVDSSNSEGAEIVVTDGPFKGLKGFVPKENVD